MRTQSSLQRTAYLESVFGLPDSDLQEIQEEMRRQGCEGMGLSGSEIRLLQFFVKSLGLRRILEVGTLFGRSCLGLARALPEGGEIVSLERNPKNFEVASQFVKASPEASRVRLILGEAAKSLQELSKEEPFDMMLIDADKAAYPQYLDWAEHHLRPGGLIVGDNSFLWGGVWGEPWKEASPKAIEAMKSFNQRLADQTRYLSMVVPSEEGITLAIKKF